MRDRRGFRARGVRQGERSAPRPRSALARGFTLLELMVVVTIIALLAVIAAPSFSVARNDRLCFDYARQYQQIIHKARSRAAGRGAAHLVLVNKTGRGFIRTFEALDGVAPGGPTPGPNPVSSCKSGVPFRQWDHAVAYTPGAATSNQARFVPYEYLDLNSTVGVNVDMDIRTDLTVYRTGKPDWAAICVTPSGVTYVGTGASADAAVNQMTASVPFNDVLEIDIQRHQGGQPAGLRRKVLVAGNAAPRIKSE